MKYLTEYYLGNRYLIWKSIFSYTASVADWRVCGDAFSVDKLLQYDRYDIFVNCN